MTLTQIPYDWESEEKPLSWWQRLHIWLAATFRHPDREMEEYLVRHNRRMNEANDSFEGRG